MDYQVSTEDSYAERRQLFKNIWETAMNIEEKDPDIMTKPKVIKYVANYSVNFINFTRTCLNLFTRMFNKGEACPS